MSSEAETPLATEGQRPSMTSRWPERKGYVAVGLSTAHPGYVPIHPPGGVSNKPLTIGSFLSRDGWEELWHNRPQLLGAMFILSILAMIMLLVMMSR